MSLNLGGIANAYLGFRVGQDSEIERQRKEEDRAYQTSQRAYNQGQQNRTLDEQTRADQLRNDLSGVATEKDVANTEPTAVNGEAYGPSAPEDLATKTKVKRFNDEIYRDQAAVFQRQGKIDEAMKLNSLADKIGSDRSARLFSQLDATAAGKSPLEIAKAAAKIYSGDPHAGSIKNVTQLPDGSISIDAENKLTGESRNRVYKTSDEMMNDLRSYYSPEMQAKLQAQRAGTQQKIEIENSKFHVLPPGGLGIQGGKVVTENTTGYVQDGTNADGSPRMVKAAVSGSGKRADHFDEKQWDAAARIEKDTVSLPDPTGEKLIPSTELRSAYMQAFNQARAGGTLSPNQAVEYATTTISKLKDIAGKRVEKSMADGKAITINQAVRDILREASRFQPPAASAPAPAANASPMTARPGDSDRSMILNSELAKARSQLASAKDPDSVRRAQSDVDSLMREMKANKISETAAPQNTNAAVAQTNIAQAATNNVAPKKQDQQEQAPEFMDLRNKAKSLDSKILELQNDFNTVTSLNGRRGVDPAVPGRIKAQIAQLKAQRQELLDKSDAAYMAAARAQQVAPSARSADLNSKYAN